jgi:hypothetical protein
MSSRVRNLHCSYGDLLVRSLIPVTLVTAERWAAAIDFLTQQAGDNLDSSLSERDERLLGGYRRAFGGKLDRSEANRLLSYLCWVRF